jgi:hypothetical protein
MSERFLTFNELSDDRFMLEGQMAEFPWTGGEIHVGKIIGTTWWPGKHIRRIELVEVRAWTTKWSRCGAYFLDFELGDFEHFSGPYQTEAGDIFFILGSAYYVRIFHKDGELQKPLGFDPLYAVHRRFMDPEPPKGRVA